ncbi:MAG TPA: YtxH domain-containing protein [Chitinophagaceae bacterium]|nr:YtxH domain-containing protein [Chitinophagaceae bacterium]
MKNTSKILIALGTGVAIGGVLGILFAPDKGIETRHKIAEGSKKLKDEFTRKLRLGKEKLEKEVEKVNDEIADAFA